MQSGVAELVADAVAARDRERLVGLGVTQEIADALIDPQPAPVPALNERGEPLGPDDEFNLRGATKAVRRGREQAERALQAMQAEWSTEQAPPQAEVVHTEPAQPAQTQQPSPEHQQQAEALAAQRFQLEHERAALNLSAEERAIHQRIALRPRQQRRGFFSEFQSRSPSRQQYV